MQEPKLLNMKQVCQRTTLSRATIWRLKNKGKFPKSMQISEGRVAFVTAEIDAWIESQRSMSSANTKH
jgi:prophage regulatory protein